MAIQPKAEPTELLASRVAVGHCVIINDCDRPYGRSVAVVTGISRKGVTAKYLSSSVNMAECFNSKIEHVTPVNAFGVSVFAADEWFRCEQVVNFTRAKYPDGGKRYWQEASLVIYDAKKHVLALAVKASLMESVDTPKDGTNDDETSQVQK